MQMICIRGMPSPWICTRQPGSWHSEWWSTMENAHAQMDKLPFRDCQWDAPCLFLRFGSSALQNAPFKGAPVHLSTANTSCSGSTASPLLEYAHLSTTPPSMTTSTGTDYRTFHSVFWAVGCFFFGTIGKMDSIGTDSPFCLNVEPSSLVSCLKWAGLLVWFKGIQTLAAFSNSCVLQLQFCGGASCAVRAFCTNSVGLDPPTNLDLGFPSDMVRSLFGIRKG